MGMDVNMLACVRALAENRIQDAKKYAVCCCANDNTKKNESQVKRCKNLLLNGPNISSCQQISTGSYVWKKCPAFMPSGTLNARRPDYQMTLAKKGCGMSFAEKSRIMREAIGKISETGGESR